jgi:hypothetical protein
MFIGTLQIGWMLYQQHVMGKVAREAANMISRQTPFATVESAMTQSQLYPGSGGFSGNATLILSVVTLGTGGSNAGLPIISQRRVIGGLGGSSQLGNPGAGSYTGGPTYSANNPNDDTGILATLPAALLPLTTSQAVFVSELYMRRSDLIPLTFLGLTPPDTFYSSAFF